MKSLTGKVAVVTGGGHGLGRALGERFAQEGMKVVLADIVPERLEETVADLREQGHEVTGVPTDVSKYESVEALRDATLAAYGSVHVVCNNAGIGAGAEGKLWEHELQDWRWAMGVNLWGVIHGVNAFVPTLLAQGEEGHIVNTSSGNGGVSPLPSTPQYAVTKAGVVTFTECLYGQLREVSDLVSCSVLFPGPHMLRTGLFESWRHRPDEFAKETPRPAPYLTYEDMETMMKSAGVDVQYTPVEHVAAQVVDALLADQFWIQPVSDRNDAQLTARYESMLKRSNPDYLRAVPG